jgi:hypothetical protein
MLHSWLTLLFIKLDWKGIPWDKRSSLFSMSASNEDKQFYSVDTWTNVGAKVCIFVVVSFMSLISCSIAKRSNLMLKS